MPGLGPACQPFCECQSRPSRTRPKHAGNSPLAAISHACARSPTRTLCARNSSTATHARPSSGERSPGTSPVSKAGFVSQAPTPDHLRCKCAWGRLVALNRVGPGKVQVGPIGSTLCVLPAQVRAGDAATHRPPNVVPRNPSPARLELRGRGCWQFSWCTKHAVLNCAQTQAPMRASAGAKPHPVQRHKPLEPRVLAGRVGMGGWAG